MLVTNQSKKIHKERKKHVKDRLMSEKAMSNINREYIKKAYEQGIEAIILLIESIVRSLSRILYSFLRLL